MPHLGGSSEAIRRAVCGSSTFLVPSIQPLTRKPCSPCPGDFSLDDRAHKTDQPPGLPPHREPPDQSPIHNVRFCLKRTSMNTTWHHVRYRRKRTLTVSDRPRTRSTVRIRSQTAPPNSLEISVFRCDPVSGPYARRIFSRASLVSALASRSDLRNSAQRGMSPQKQYSGR
jgi:hypothetical protein